MKMLYKSDRTFKIWGFTVSHNSLLMRSPMKFEDEVGYNSDFSYNLDIEFWDVTYIGIPSTLNGLILSESDGHSLLKGIDGNLLKHDRKVFEFQTKNNKYSIIAGGLLVGINKWVNKDRIFNFNQNLEHEKVLLRA